VLPGELRTRYRAPLEIPLRADRPTIIANFVSTLDGVVALDQIGASGGREISGGFEPDRFVMGLLRATADAVLIGAGTLRASRTHGWTPGHAHPASLPAFAAFRRALDLAPSPATIIVTASGAIDARHIPTDPNSPVVLITTQSGARRLSAGLPDLRHVEIAPVSDTESISAKTLVSFLGARGFRLVLSEGGPAIFGQLIAARVVDELFLTIAPQLAGRSAVTGRLSLVEGVALAPGSAPWAHLRSVMRSNDHLFLRYQLPSPDRKDLS
jgi:riboflavin biosynthesis pyrimidine reductase